MSNTIQHLIAQAKADSNIIALWLYGSRARGNANSDSDYDLAVLFKQSPTDDAGRRAPLAA